VADSMPKLMCFSGSLRAKSSSTAVLGMILDRRGDRIAAERFDLTSLPYYNADLDTEEPLDPVKALKEGIGSADGVIIVTPEYNYSVPGVLKNAIDWASRPGYNSVFKGKPVFVVTVSGGALGGVRAQSHLKYILNGMLAKPFIHQEIVVPAANAKVEDGAFRDEAIETFMLDAFDAFLETL